jgi:hypothetical protein
MFRFSYDEKFSELSLYQTARKIQVHTMIILSCLFLNIPKYSLILHTVPFQVFMNNNSVILWKEHATLSYSHLDYPQHNFQPLGLKPAANLPDFTAATSMLPSTGMKMLYTQGQLCEDKQCKTNDNILHDAWSFSGSFTLEPRRSKEVTEL